MAKNFQMQQYGHCLSNMVMKDDKKCLGVAERFNWTIKLMIEKYLTINNKEIVYSIVKKVQMQWYISPAEGSEIVGSIHGSVLLLELFPNLIRRAIGHLSSKVGFGEESLLDLYRGQITWHILTGAAFNIIITPFESLKRKLADYNIQNSTDVTQSFFDLDADRIIDKYGILVMINSRGTFMSNIRHALAHANIFPFV